MKNVCIHMKNDNFGLFQISPFIRGHIRWRILLRLPWHQWTRFSVIADTCGTRTHTTIKYEKIKSANIQICIAGLDAEKLRCCRMSVCVFVRTVSVVPRVQPYCRIVRAQDMRIKQFRFAYFLFGVVFLLPLLPSVAD